MKSFDLVEPATLEEAVALLDPDDAGVRVLAGGTALMLMMKARLFQPARLISLRRLDGAMRGVREDGVEACGSAPSRRSWSSSVRPWWLRRFRC